MAQESAGSTPGITVKFDPTLELPEIKMFLNNPGPDETDGPADDSSMQQTKITGIIAPLVKINDQPIPVNSVISMELTCAKVPTVTLSVEDKMGLIETFDKPRPDNAYMQIQILPPFDNAYKKVNIPFYITDSEIDNESRTITLSGVYDVKGWHDNKMKAYGQVTTYEFFEQVAKDYQLGFASNLSGTDDRRWIYVPQAKVASILTQECKFGGGGDTEEEGEKAVMLDWWIDYWNNLNLVDIRERNNTIDKKEDMQVWILPSRQPKTETTDVNEPFKTEAMVTNNEVFRDTQAYVSQYQSQNNSGGNLSGSDRVIEFYKTEDLETDNYLLQDKDVVKNIYLRYDYIGENFGDYSYLLHGSCRSAFMKKINSQKIIVDLFTPSLALAKGTKVNFYWYKVQEMTSDTKFADVETNIETPDNVTEKNEYTGLEPGKIPDDMVIDKQISGQYYIEQSDFIYNYNGGGYNWQHRLTLTRPADQEERFYWDDITTEKPKSTNVNQNQ